MMHAMFLPESENGGPVADQPRIWPIPKGNAGSVGRNGPELMEAGPVYARAAPRNTNSNQHNLRLLPALTKQIPEFSGEDTENVEAWITRAEKIAIVHRVDHELLLLAATAKLGGEARRWFDHQHTIIMTDWSEFKEKIIGFFKRRVPFYMLLRKIEARTWNASKESFDTYALDKMTLMSQCELSVEDQINLIAAGISSESIRSIALCKADTTLEGFLLRMRRVTDVKGFETKKHQGGQQETPQHRKSVKPEAEGTTRSKTEIKNRGGLTQGESKTSSGSKVNQVVSEVNSSSSMTCEEKALVDTGSPISLLPELVFKKHCNLNQISPAVENSTFVSLSNTPIDVLGLVKVKFEMEEIPNVPYEHTFYLIQDGCLDGSIIMGRDVLENHNLSLLYTPGKGNCEKGSDKQINLIDEHLASMIGTLEEINENDKRHIEEIRTDFGFTCDQQVKSIIKGVAKEPIKKVKDDFMVSVKLRDHTPFAYSPRRFAAAERLQIREITEDLLKIGIIKTSTSPYCSRIVPVRKKSGSIRLCVDLRPLNSRVYRQHYPFPVIEDFLSRLNGKSAFSLLEMKDGFHQIKLHPDSTKYFAFATPDAQYEY
ncbi:uncharacterized protein [Prorops nasuta]|uniref:uncharacterized protein n=1 Tax=Prorops nasuta TaxID=863751 RepID=UPI0034CE0881